MSLLVTAGQAGDAPQFEAVMNAIAVPRQGPGRPRQRPHRVLADKTYSSRAIRSWLRRHGIAATIPQPCDQQAHRRRRGHHGGRPPAFDPQHYRRRNVARTLHQPPQTMARPGHAHRQTRRALPGPTHRRRDPALDKTVIRETLPSSQKHEPQPADRHAQPHRPVPRPAPPSGSDSAPPPGPGRRERRRPMDNSSTSRPQTTKVAIYYQPYGPRARELTGWRNGE